MSNGDVLDNWEEFDEAGLKSLQKSVSSQHTTEKITVNTSLHNSQSFSSLNTAAQTSSQQPQMKLLQRSATSQDSASVLSRPMSSANTKQSPLDDMAATFQPVMMVLHKPVDEYESANYTQPIANQTVKILRRPTQSSEPRNNDIRPKQPIKTLKQREQEYAEARLRILGSAKNPEDEEQRASSTPPTVATSSSNSTPATPTSATTQSAAGSLQTTPVSIVAKVNSPKTQGGPNMFNNHYQFQQQQQQQQQIQQQQFQQPQYDAFDYLQRKHLFLTPHLKSPAYNSNNNNRTFSSMPLLGHGPMGSIGQPAQYQQPQAPQAQQQQMKIQQQYHKSSQQQQLQKQQTWSPVVGGSVSSGSLRQQQNENLLRLPRGPDGTIGFQMRR